MKTAALPPAVTSLSELDPAGLYTFADYLRWQLEERVELIRGRLWKMSPAPGTRHQQVSQAINRVMLNFFYRQSCQVFTAPFDVRLPAGSRKGDGATVVQPDLCVVCDPAKLDEHGCNGAPDLVVEILSPGNSSREMGEKFRVYEESGVREYWMVNPAERAVMAYVLDERGVFTGRAPALEGDAFRSAVFPELVIDLKEVFV